MTTDPAAIAKGVLLPFGGYKGSAIALMVELLAAGLTGEQFSFEARATDNGDGGPPRGGEMILGLAPSVIAGEGWEAHVEGFVEKLQALDGIRLPGARRHITALILDHVRSMPRWSIRLKTCCNPAVILPRGLDQPSCGPPQPGPCRIRCR